MTKNTQKIEAPRPVADWENRAVNGAARACKRIHESEVAKVAELRQRQEEYEASLPKEPLDALSEINRCLHDTRDISAPEYAVRAALEIIHQLATHDALDESAEMKYAIHWLSGQAIQALTSIEGGTRRARNIAHQFHSMHETFRA